MRTIVYLSPHPSSGEVALAHLTFISYISKILLDTLTFSLILLQFFKNTNFILNWF